MRQFDALNDKYTVNWIYPHWFRAQRASQFSADYNMSLNHVADWFEWEELKTARIYIGTSAEIRERMDSANPSWKRL